MTTATTTTVVVPDMIAPYKSLQAWIHELRFIHIPDVWP